MKMQMTRISILQSSKIVTALYALLGFLYTFVGIPMILFGGRPIKIMGIIYVLMPAILAIFGFVFFSLFGALYNWLATWLGGIEMEIKNLD